VGLLAKAGPPVCIPYNILSLINSQRSLPLNHIYFNYFIFSW